MKKLVYTRKYLQGLTRKIEYLENAQVIGFAPRGTGVRAFAWEIGQKQKMRDKANVLRAQRRLVERGLIEILQTGNQAQILLTNDGAIQATKDRILLTEDELPEGTECLVSFDIPESVNKLRCSLRRFLKKAGFSQKQLSVWVSRKNVVKDMKSLIDLLGISHWVDVFSVEQA